MNEAAVVVERRGPVLSVGLDRPAQRNALDQAMVAQLHAALDEAALQPCVLVVHSTTPGIFAAGADLRELLRRNADDAMRRINVDLFDRLERHRWPTIAAVDGPAIGAGCELALACDLRICSPRARFGQPEPSLGILAGAGGHWRLPQAVGIGTARRMLYLGATLPGDEAEEAGLVDEVSEAPFDAALAMAATIAERPWRALELTKLALGLHRPATSSFDVVAQALSFDGDDKRQRIQAFLDRPKDRDTKRREPDRSSHA